MGLAPGHGEVQTGDTGQTRLPKAENRVATFTGMGRDSDHIRL